MQWPEGARLAATRLIEGNRQFIRGIEASVAADERSRTLSTADPVAVVLGCSDSRVPPEIVLDQDIGQLFVLRVAGNVAGSAELASIEYAIARWGCALVLVLGHTQCGAVGAALDPPPPGADAGPDLGGVPHLASLLVDIRANMALAPGEGDNEIRDVDRWRAAVEANARTVAESLHRRSGLLHARVAEGLLAIAPAVYDVQSGGLAFLDGGGLDDPGASPLRRG